MNNSSNFIQALMDYGSIICLPNNPKCNLCIIQKNCKAFKKKLINQIPFKNNKKLKKIKYTRAYIIRNELNEILVRRRPSSGMLQSMMEIPNDPWVEKYKSLKHDKIIKSFSIKLFKIKKKLIYSFSHFDLHIEIFFAKIKKNALNKTKIKWIKLSRINSSGFPSIMQKIVKLYIQLI